jgi:hypothetical protein
MSLEWHSLSVLYDTLLASVPRRTKLTTSGTSLLLGVPISIPGSPPLSF